MPSSIDKDACDLLDADHLAVKQRFVQYARLAYAPEEPAARSRANLAAAICDALTVHAQIEEEIFYPALRQAVPDADDLVDEAAQEHQEAKDLIQQIRGASTAGATMDMLVAQLARAVEEHVKEERDELFPKARAARTLDLVALGRELATRQEQLLQGAAAEA